MKKLLAPVVAVLLVAPVLSAEAGRSRTASGEYNTLVISDEQNPTSGYFTNTVKFKVKRGERFVSVVLADKSGLPAVAIAGMDHNGDGFPEDSQEICGETQAPIRVHPGMTFVVAAQEGPCEDGTTAMSTFGTVTATFTR